jgi:hypothetical protein
MTDALVDWIYAESQRIRGERVYRPKMPGVIILTLCNSSLNRNLASRTLKRFSQHINWGLKRKPIQYQIKEIHYPLVFVEFETGKENGNDLGTTD